MKKSLLLLLSGIFCLSINGCGLIWANVNNEQISQVQVISTLVKNTAEGSQYIVSLKIGNEVEPIEVDNNFFGLGRLDRTSIFSQLEDIKNRNVCISGDVHGYRIPSISYRGLGKFSEVKCKAKH